LAASEREALDHLWLRLSGIQVMLQTTICDGLAFDPFAFEGDGLCPPEVVACEESGGAFSRVGESLHLRESGGCRLVSLQIEWRVLLQTSLLTEFRYD
jgi:hypothetical protein